MRHLALPCFASAVGFVALLSCSQAPPPQPAPRENPFARDSVVSMCLRGDTTALLLADRKTGRTRTERWIQDRHGRVVDLVTGRTVMDSAEASRLQYGSLLRQQRELEARTADLARRTGATLPVEQACGVAPGD